MATSLEPRAEKRSSPNVGLEHHAVGAGTFHGDFGRLAEPGDIRTEAHGDRIGPGPEPRSLLRNGARGQQNGRSGDQGDETPADDFEKHGEAPGLRAVQQRL